MKKDLEKKRTLLEDDASPYFCGSACLLSLLMVVKTIEKDFLDYQKAFPELQKVILSLFDDDPELFDLSKKTDLLMDGEWKKVMSVFDDYALLIENLTELIDVCVSTHKERYVPSLRDDLRFLIDIVSFSLDSFIHREDKPEEFERHMNIVLSAIRKEARS